MCGQTGTQKVGTFHINAEENIALMMHWQSNTLVCYNNTYSHNKMVLRQSFQVHSEITINHSVHSKLLGILLQ